MKIHVFWKKMGPAWLISAVACGPATLVSVITAGSEWGIRMLPVVLISVFFGVVAQLLAVEAGVRGGGLIEIVASRISPKIALILTINACLVTWWSAAFLMNSVIRVLEQISGWQSFWWAPLIVTPLFLGSRSRGYRFFEWLSKAVILLMVALFGVTLMFSDFSRLVLWPAGNWLAIFDDPQTSLKSAAIVGGAAHITIIVMHTYNIAARRWSFSERGLARADTALSMGLFFGLYSLLLFFLAVVNFAPQNIVPQSSGDIARLLTPLLGQAAGFCFSVGLIGATFSSYLPTVFGGACIVAAHYKIPLSEKDKRFRLLLALGFVISLLGGLIPGGPVKLLPVMLAFALTGTPLVLILLIYLLAGPLKKEDLEKGRQPASLTLLVSGIAVVIVSVLLAAKWLIGLPA